ncbi:SMI1/KNR4 family protein [Marinimicrobium sp. ARAG 43.8]|uniref:SMI1/KNR4 family protein n=1 Tax=Marinimicrobium sp. ARAG 43.8 TaxID=3418719 RepID=UPI003CF4DD92
MEQTLERLRRAHQPVPVPLELPGEDELVEVEEELLLPIPREMRRFLLTASDIVTGSLEPVTAADPHSHTYLPEVAAVAWSMGLPRYLLPLCESHGNYYCVEPEGEVLFWREGELTDEAWDDVWQWAREVWLES